MKYLTVMPKTTNTLPNISYAHTVDDLNRLEEQNNSIVIDENSSKVLPDTITLEYLHYDDALISAVKFIPLLYEGFNGVNYVTSSKPKKQIVIVTGSKQTFKFRYVSSLGLKRFTEDCRSSSFANILYCFEELKKLEGVQIHLKEDIQQKLFCINLNYLDVVKSSYKFNDIHNIKALNDIKEHIIQNPIPELPNEVKCREYGRYIVSKYKSVEITKTLFNDDRYQHLDFIPYERISVSTRELPMLNPALRKPGTSLDITSERKDRFDHDD